jgi:uncharacterized membrane protein YgdD (TMEM256/DUF423 family)
MHRGFLMMAALFGGLGVAAGAFGAHGLENITSDEKIIHGFQTGVQYQIYHALALMAVAIIYGRTHLKAMMWAGNFFIVGIFLFSGSLYALTYLKIQESTAIKFIGPVTPIGGLCFIIGWLCLALGANNYKIKPEVPGS